MLNRLLANRIVFASVAIVAAVIVGLGIRFYLAPSMMPRVSISGTALIGGPFTLVDQDGKTRSDAEFRGKLMLVYFGYTYCPDICPTELQAMSDALDILGDKGKKVQPIFITIDPARDSMKAMKAYVSHFHKSLIGLTGTPEQIAVAAKAYRVYYAKVPAKDGGNDYLMDHSGLIYLMGPDGKYLTHFVPSTTPEQMAAAIAKHL